MNGLKLIALTAFAACCMFVSAPKVHAQINVEIGAAPDCPYGYYDAAPYECAPYGYYGHEWFNGGVFLGTGPWFRGPDNFRGRVNNRFHPEHGYNGPRPQRGEQRDASRSVEHVSNFRGNETRDGRGHVAGRH
jgi:hypothetical protein